MRLWRQIKKNFRAMVPVLPLLPKLRYRQSQTGSVAESGGATGFFSGETFAHPTASNKSKSAYGLESPLTER
jgi:hypothetical protein